MRGRPSVDGSRPSPDTAGLQDREKATSVVFGCNGPNRQRQRPGRGWGAAGASREDPAQFLSTGVDGPQGREARGGSWWRRRRGPMLSGRGPHQAPCIPAQPHAPRPGGPCMPGAEPGPHLRPALRAAETAAPPARQKGACGQPAFSWLKGWSVKQPRHRTRLLIQKQCCISSPFCACFKCS